jgi:cytochrome c biogenesis protein CcdA
MLFGKRMSAMTTPTSVRDGMKKHVSSIYVLGIFSAIATTCCAPVLAGVLALSVSSGSIFLGVFYTLAYVVGMTLPLFVIAAFLDKANLTEKFTGAKKMVKMKMVGFEWRITISELISSVIFILMGG